MSIIWIGLNPRLEGKIRHRFIANGLQDFQFVTNPFTFSSVKNSVDQNGSDRSSRSADFLYTPTKINPKIFLLFYKEPKINARFYPFLFIELRIHPNILNNLLS